MSQREWQATTHIAILRRQIDALAERHEATRARLEQIIELSRRDDTHTCGRIRELAERALTDLSHLEEP